MKTAEQRKQQSIERLKKEGVPYIEGLPALDEAKNITLKTPKEIAKRAIACLITIQAVFDQDAGEYTPDVIAWYQNLFAQYEIDNLTHNELALLEMKADEQDRVNMIWKYEAYWSLIWALGFIDELKFPSESMTTEECQFAINLVSNCNDLEEFIKKIKLRSLEEILDQADLIYRYHWACVDARINGKSAPQNLFESVVMERRAGLDWLIDENADWDYPNLST